MVRASLGQQLYAIVNVQQSLELVVADLLLWIDRRGTGALEALLQGALAARPSHQLLKDFCLAYFKGNLPSFDATILVKSFANGLQLLIDLRNDPAVRQTVGGFRADLATTELQITVMRKYKALHDVLHEIQVRLAAVLDALARKNDPAASRTLRTYLVDLGQYAKTARAETPDLPTRFKEEEWVDDFDACVADIKAAAAGQPAAPDSDPLPDRLKNILHNAGRINDLLVTHASSLRLDRFTETMETIADKLKGFTGPQDNTMQLFESSKAVGVLRAQLDGLIAQHNEWQTFTTRLEIAEDSPKHQPQARVQKWKQFETSIRTLCAAYPEADWSTQLLPQLDAWIAATPSAQPDDNEKFAGESAFAEFQRGCVLRFYDVDKTLNALCGKIAEMAQPIDTLLKAI